MPTITLNVAAVAFACGVIAGAALSVSPAVAEVSFKGKRIDVIMGTSPGGGNDGTTRLVGRYLEKYLPGGPELIYRNMPGGTGVKALNYFAASVKPDGLGWAGGGNAHISPNTLRQATTKFDPTKFVFIGGVARGGNIVFINKDKLRNLMEPSLPPAVVGETGGGRNWSQMMMFGREALGWNIRFVIGYPGAAHMMLAVRRGEIDVMGSGDARMLKDVFQTGKFVGLAQMGYSMGQGQVEGRSGFDHIPVLQTLVAGKFTGVAAEAFEFWTFLNELDKWYALPPGTPGDIVAAYRDAYGKSVKDPDFLKNATVQFSDDFRAMDGALLQTIVGKISYPSPEIIGFIENMKAKNGLPAEPLSDEEVAKLAKEKGLDKLPAIRIVLLEVGDGGRNIVFMADGQRHKADVSSGRTQVTLGGQKADRKQLAAGLTCEVSYPGDQQEATAINCQ